MQLIYEVTNESEMVHDFEILKDGFQLLEYDYLGGSGSRGYGRVKIMDIHVEPVIGEVSEDVLSQCQKIINHFRFIRHLINQLHRKFCASYHTFDLSGVRYCRCSLDAVFKFNLCCTCQPCIF